MQYFLDGWYPFFISRDIQLSYPVLHKAMLFDYSRAVTTAFILKHWHGWNYPFVIKVRQITSFVSFENDQPVQFSGALISLNVIRHSLNQSFVSNFITGYFMFEVHLTTKMIKIKQSFRFNVIWNVYDDFSKRVIFP